MPSSSVCGEVAAVGVRTRFGLVLALLAGGCQLATDFTLTPVEETTDALCTDGEDNDFDGLTDCQDWNCRSRLPCCDIPEVILVDDFEDGPASCDDEECTGATCSVLQCGPDAERWITWPCPYPKVCAGALHIDKTNCFAGGALSQKTVDLAPGLRVEADLLGRPERLGYLEIALTLQDPGSLAGSLDPCGRDQKVTGFAALRQVWNQDGYQLTALLQDAEVGRSPVVTDEESHTVALAIDEDHVLVYYLDGQPFATSPGVIPPTSAQARVAISGLTEQVTVDAIRVQAGLRCHDPGAWTPAAETIEDSVVLVGDDQTPAAFDADEVFHPSVLVSGNTVDLYYTGCWWSAGSTLCEPYQLGIGHASSVGGGTYQRDAGNPLLAPDDLSTVGLLGIHRDMSVTMLPSPNRGYVAPGNDNGIYGVDEKLVPTPSELIPLGGPGAWDEAEICCATALEYDGTTYLWYAGRQSLDSHRWRLGLATSTDGITFERYPDNPVMSVGETGAFDAETVISPVVVRDQERGLFLMWYEGRDFFGLTAIGYAVSTDGVTWHRYPGNPVMAPEVLGLASIGGPEVHRDADGRLRAWVHGTTNEQLRRRIFAFENQGTLIDAVTPTE